MCWNLEPDQHLARTYVRTYVLPRLSAATPPPSLTTPHPTSDIRSDPLLPPTPRPSKSTTTADTLIVTPVHRKFDAFLFAATGALASVSTICHHDPLFESLGFCGGATSCWCQD